MNTLLYYFLGSSYHDAVKQIIMSRRATLILAVGPGVAENAGVSPCGEGSEGGLLVSHAPARHTPHFRGRHHLTVEARVQWVTSNFTTGTLSMHVHAAAHVA
jgi:hypothetical protein